MLTPSLLAVYFPDPTNGPECSEGYGGVVVPFGAVLSNSVGVSGDDEGTGDASSVSSHGRHPTIKSSEQDSFNVQVLG